ncbi:MAG: hypothetical protein ACOZCP_06420 [Pseudomonadota bacterium]
MYWKILTLSIAALSAIAVAASEPAIADRLTSVEGAVAKTGGEVTLSLEDIQPYIRMHRQTVR